MGGHITHARTWLAITHTHTHTHAHTHAHIHTHTTQAHTTRACVHARANHLCLPAPFRVSGLDDEMADAEDSDEGEPACAPAAKTLGLRRGSSSEEEEEEDAGASSEEGSSSDAEEEAEWAQGSGKSAVCLLVRGRG